MMRFMAAAFAVLMLGALSGCERETVSADERSAGERSAGERAGDERATDRASFELVAPSELPGLENVFRPGSRIWSGGEPHGDEGFASLRELGIRTILSVDGIRPDLERAHAAGMGYVHVPIGYDGVSEEDAARVARALRERPGPFFIHCHHGKHRGPAAAAVAIRIDDGATTERAHEVMRVAGVGQEYPGLWRDAAALDLAAVAAIEVPPPAEAVEAESRAAGMADLDRRWEELRLCEKAGWTTPEGHADLAPAHLARIVEEAFREMARAEDEAVGASAAVEAVSSDDHEDYSTRLRDSEKLARELREALETGRPEDATDRVDKIAKSCSACHRIHRNPAR